MCDVARDSGARIRALAVDGGDSSVEGYRALDERATATLMVPALRVGWLEPPQ